MFGRILALVLKELASLWKDPRTRFVLLAPPLVQVMVFSYAASFEVTHVPLAVWNEDAGQASRDLVAGFQGSPRFTIVATPDNPAAAAALIDRREAAAVLHIPQTFSADRLAGRTAHVQLLVDARRSNTALLVSGYAASVIAADALAGAAPPVAVETRDWFNPTLEPKWFILPGLVAVLSLIMSMIVGALSLARERELGTFEQMLVTPLTPIEVLIGKAVPAVVVGMVEAHIVIAAALLWFGLPFVGSLWLLEASLLVFMLSGAALGLAISAFAHTQQQAILGVFVFASPIIVLSGFASPVENIPGGFGWLSVIDPMRYMLVLAREIFLQDMPVAVAVQQIWPMAAMAVVLMGVATAVVRRAVS